MVSLVYNIQAEAIRFFEPWGFKDANFQDILISGNCDKKFLDFRKREYESILFKDIDQSDGHLW